MREVEENSSTLLDQNRLNLNAEIAAPHAINRRSKSANDIVRNDIQWRVKIAEQINKNEESVSLIKSSEFGTVSILMLLIILEQHKLFSLLF